MKLVLLDKKVQLSFMAAGKSADFLKRGKGQPLPQEIIFRTKFKNSKKNELFASDKGTRDISPGLSFIQGENRGQIS